jgi:hypothetical protein
MTITRKISLPPRSIFTKDREYNDYKLYASWTDDDIFFVTWLKHNAGFTILEENPIPIACNELRDQFIRFNGFYAQKDFLHILRRVVV